jgi:hypothetical protein
MSFECRVRRTGCAPTLDLFTITCEMHLPYVVLVFDESAVDSHFRLQVKEV